ncbi:hypothetical protein AGMMS4956_14180 [Bacteroidia bacterium]|nr:hypothetical protein AGMMS4956_14180 [Bacteroidia bacterium]
MKKLVFMLTLCVSFVVGGTFSALAGVAPVVGGAALCVVSLLSPLFGIDGLRAGIYPEIWTGETVKAFRTSVESIGWLNKIRSYDQYTKENVIHWIVLGGDPDVLINNSTYPLDVQTLTDGDKSISLDKYQTKPTVITDDELQGIGYDKIGSVIERHRDMINEKKYAKAIHALAPAADTTATPVIVTNGVNSADGTRKTITRTEIIALKKAFDAQKIPTTGRVLVLCSDHVSDLLSNDQKFVEQYYNYQSGKISNLYGFEVYEYNDCPYYTVSSKAKLAFGAVATDTERQASVAFYAPRMMKATGETKAYLSEAKTDPKNQENLANFRHYFICLPLKNEAIGAIVSGVV